jgi:hypothetical protein
MFRIYSVNTQLCTFRGTTDAEIYLRNSDIIYNQQKVMADNIISALSRNITAGVMQFVEKEGRAVAQPSNIMWV